MSDLITTLKEKGTNNNVYPNIKHENIPSQTITNDKIANNAITTNKIADNAITTPKINNRAITEAKIDFSAITTTRLANECVTTPKVKDGAITPDKLSFGLYEHNIVIANQTGDRYVNSDNVVAFSFINQNPSEYTSISDFAQLLYDRGFNSLRSFLKATGRTSNDSCDVVESVNFQAQTTETDCIDSIVIGVYVDSDYDLNVVYTYLNEGGLQMQINGEVPNTTYFHDNVVQLM